MKSDAFEHPRTPEDSSAASLPEDEHPAGTARQGHGDRASSHLEKCTIRIMRRLVGSFAMVSACAVIAAGAVIACSDDDDATGGSTVPDASGVDVVQPPPPPPPNFPDAPAPPPDLVSRSGFMGNATLIADVGEPTDGPAWRSVDGALYFTVPGSASPLRRVVPGGTASRRPAARRCTSPNASPSRRSTSTTRAPSRRSRA
jgi:hypothetical protein